MTPSMRVVLLAAAVALLAGCDSGSGATRSAPPPPSPRADLVAQADLERCPRSSTSAVDGGLPDLTLPCLGGGPAVHLAGLTGRPTLVNIWGSWCVPCQREAQYLNRAHRDLSPRVRFLGVDTLDDPNSALDFAVHVEPPMRYASVYDDDKRVLIAVGGSSGPPVTLFVDAEGRLVHRTFGEYTSDAELRADIAEYLGVRA